MNDHNFKVNDWCTNFGLFYHNIGAGGVNYFGGPQILVIKSIKRFDQLNKRADRATGIRNNEK